jgi:hypothetical protein
MISPHEDGRRAPSPQQLAAYADGELDGPEQAPLKRRVEDWLATHAEAAAAVEGQRALTRLWQETTPPEPAESTWAEMLDCLEQLPHPLARTRSWLAAWVAGLLVACAAAVWLTVVWLQPRDKGEVVEQRRPEPPGKTNGAPKLAPETIEPFAVARADEIEILSVGGADTATLVVGEVPVRGVLVLAAVGDVEVQRTDSELRVAGSPMIWTPLENERDDDP